MVEGLRGYLSYLLESDLVEFALAVAVALSFVDLVQSLARTFLGPVITAATSPPGQPVSPPFTPTNLALFLVPSVLAFLATVLLAAVYLVLRLRLPPDPAKRACPECLSEIPAEARRCAYCAAVVDGGPPPTRGRRRLRRR